MQAKGGPIWRVPKNYIGLGWVDGPCSARGVFGHGKLLHAS